jgi:hypothetical protein
MLTNLVIELATSFGPSLEVHLILFVLSWGAILHFSNLLWYLELEKDNQIPFLDSKVRS